MLYVYDGLLSEQVPLHARRQLPVNIPELSKEEKIRLMEARLKDAVRREEYEEAAKLRDEIRALKEEKQNG